MPEKLPMSRALLRIFLSTLMISGLAWMAWLYHLQLRGKHIQDEQYQIVAVVQSSAFNENLKTVYLAELLNLSVDRPQNLYQFSLEKGRKRLLRSPLIKTVNLKKIIPGTIYVDYAVRLPIAYLGDYTNTAIDAEGYLLPFSPFFTPKKIPIFYLGLENMDYRWGSSLKSHAGLQLALEVYASLKNVFKSDVINIKQVDVSQAFADSYGKRQIVVLIEEILHFPLEGKNQALVKPYFLRLSTDQYAQNLANYYALRQYLFEQIKDANVLKPDIIDLRIAHLAFIKKGN
jgi:hypothetical protein